MNFSCFALDGEFLSFSHSRFRYQVNKSSNFHVVVVGDDSSLCGSTLLGSKNFPASFYMPKAQFEGKEKEASSAQKNRQTSGNFDFIFTPRFDSTTRLTPYGGLRGLLLSARCRPATSELVLGEKHQN